MACHLDLIPDKLLRWVYENMIRIQQWALCIEGQLSTLTDEVDGLVADSGDVAGPVAIKTAVIDVPYDVSDYEAVVVDADIDAGMNVIVGWGANGDNDENGPEIGAVTFSAVAAVGSLTIKIASEESIGGPFRVNYLAA